MTFFPRRLTISLKNWALIAGSLVLAGTISAAVIPGLLLFQDPTGVVSTVKTNGPIDTKNPFFQSLGTNGRECVTCHEPSDAWSVTPPHIKERFEQSRGRDPIFVTLDGANCPDDPRGDRKSHTLLLQNGLIRVGIELPVQPEFTIKAVHDPYGCAIITDATGRRTVSVYRRPLPATNLRFLSAVMWDGRETVAPLNDASTFTANLITDLKHQAADAVMGHAQAPAAPSDAVLTSIANFENGLITAQSFSDKAESLSADGATGGPLSLSHLGYHPGINDVLGADPSGTSFNPVAMNLFDPWADLSRDPHERFEEESRTQDREDIAAGEQIFNSFPLTITDVRGLNDNQTLNSPASITGTCTTCHDTPNVGNHSTALPLDIGTSHPREFETNPDIRDALAELQSADLPIYEIDGCPDPFHPGQTAPIFTGDPGKGLLSGVCADVNRVKGPILRGLAARAPYFHNGAAADLRQVVNFYNARFQMGLTEKEKKQLVAFLNSL